MQYQFRETGEHTRQVEDSIRLSRGRTKHHGIKFHRLMYSRVRQQDKISSIRQAAKVPTTIMSMREMATRQGPRQVIQHRSRISPGQHTLGWGVKLCRKMTSVMRWTVCTN